MRYRPPRTVIGVPSTPWVALCGGKATRQRAESRRARPGTRGLSGAEPGSAGEASAAAAGVATKHRRGTACKSTRARAQCRSTVRQARHGVPSRAASAQSSAPQAGTQPRPRRTCRRGGRRSRTCCKLGCCQVSWKNTVQNFRLGSTLLSCSPLLQGIRVRCVSNLS